LKTDSGQAVDGIRFEDRPPPVADFIRMRADCGWGELSPALAGPALDASLLAITAVDGDGRIAGFVRAIGDPLYVVKLDAATAQVVVGPREALAVDRITLKDINWLGDDALADGVPVRVKVRSTRPPVDAAFSVDGDEIAVVLPGGEEGVAPGQACVFYSAEDDGRVLGGGWIAKTSASAERSGGYRLIG